MRQPETVSFSFPKPGKALIGTMVAVSCIWVALAVSGNWANVAGADTLVEPLLGDTDKVFGGQIWRLITAPLIHDPTRPGHLVTTLLGLYFLGTPLEDRWGAKKTLIFLIGSGAFAFLLQAIVSAIAPSMGPRWFGGLGMVEAVAVAWALTARGQTVRLFFVLPVTPMMLVGFIFIMSVLSLLARSATPEGLITPFGGMLAGYLFGDGSPLRRFFLQMKLKKIQAETAALRGSARSRAGAPPLRIIHGGQKDPPKDKRYLN
jgi:membrane associated rhomboid family serine protease